MLTMMRRPEFLMMRRPEFLMMRRPEFLMMRRPCAALRRPAKGGRTASILLLILVFHWTLRKHLRITPRFQPFMRLRFTICIPCLLHHIARMSSFSGQCERLNRRLVNLLTS
jgi:hypothetical protein